MSNYGTVEGVQDMLMFYTDLVSGGQISAAMIERLLVRAGNDIDAKLSAIATTPLATVPGVIHDIACDLCVCLVLKRISLQEDINYSEYVGIFCDQPMEKLDELIKGNPGLFTASGSSEPQILSNRVGQDRTATVSEKINGVTTGDDGTMEEW